MRRFFIAFGLVTLLVWHAQAQQPAGAALTPKSHMPMIFGAIPTPTNTPTATATSGPAATPTRNPAQCAAEYPTVCIPPPPPDLNCGDIVFRNFTVLPPDRHKFDTDHDGVGCEGA